MSNASTHVPPDVLRRVAVHGLDVLGGGVAHGDHTLGHVGQVQVESLGLESPPFLAYYLPDGGGRHLARCIGQKQTGANWRKSRRSN